MQNPCALPFFKLQQELKNLITIKMKKIILSLALISIMSLFSNRTNAIIHMGQATMIGGDGVSTITFNCPGSGLCYRGSGKSGSQISINGFPGDWIVDRVIASDDGDEQGDVIQAHRVKQSNN